MFISMQIYTMLKVLILNIKELIVMISLDDIFSITAAQTTDILQVTNFNSLKDPPLPLCEATKLNLHQLLSTFLFSMLC